MLDSTPIRLGWPARCLSPNSRTDRRATTGSRKAARNEGFYAAKQAGAVIAEDAHLTVEFFPPDRIARDLDNLLASIKPHLDGIARAAGVDDKGWSFTIRKGPVVRGGAVLVHVHPADNWQAIGDLAANMVKGQVA